MTTPLEDYKALIDRFVKIRSGVGPRRVREETDWPKLPENAAINAFLAKLSKEDRQVLAEMLQSAREGGIHDALVVLNDEIALRGLQITRNDRPIAFQPFGSEMYYDWVCRCHEDDWPDPI